MGWFAELPGSQISHRSCSSNIINMCVLLRKPSKRDPAVTLPGCSSDSNSTYTRAEKDLPSLAHPHTLVLAAALSCLRAETRFTCLALPLEATAEPQPLAASSTPPGAEASAESHDVAQYHCPSFITRLVLPHPADKVSCGLMGEDSGEIHP